MPRDFFPKQDAQRVTWFANFNTKIPGYNTLFGLTAAEITAIAADNAALAYMIQQVDLFKTEVQERVAFKDLLINGAIGSVGGAYPGAFTPPAAPATLVLPGIVARLRLLVRRLKAHGSYNDAIGQDLGIIAPASPPAPGVVPTGAVRALPGSVVEGRFVKRGFDGVFVETRRADETAWTTLGNFIRSPFLDNRAPLHPGQPEVRYYRMRYLSGNNPVGNPSDILSVTTIP